MIISIKNFTILIAFVALVACGNDNGSQSDNDEPMIDAASARLASAAEEPGNWLNHGRTYDEQRHSPLDQINVGNVSDLGLEWSFDMYTARGVEATPLVVDGVMYVTSSWAVVYALDAKSGDLIWDFDPETDRAWGVNACCDVVNRGVAYYAGKIYVGTIDGWLIALDAASGEKLWETLTIDKTKPYTITGAPRVVKGKVLIGNGGAEYGVRGYISAYDADTGDMAWRFYTVPGNPADGFENAIMEKAAETWNGEWWKWGGGGTVWDSMAYDAELDLLYFGTGNGSPWNHKIRSNGVGDNLFLSSIVAVRPDTGDYVWHYQTTPGDSWDYTATQHIILADIEIEGVMRNVLMQAPKNGFFYVIDRASGELISAKNFSDINWASHVDIETGRPVEMPGVRDFTKAVRIVPSPVGAHGWPPMSFDPDSGLVYIPVQKNSSSFLEPQDPADLEYRAGLWNTGTNFVPASLPDEPESAGRNREEHISRILAWDPVKQEAVWQIDQQDYGSGGMLTTAGGLLMQVDPQGNITAYNSQTGEKLWSQWLQTGAAAPPMTYSVDGEQYIAIAAGWGSAFGVNGARSTGQYGLVNRSRVLVFKLAGNAILPDVEEPFLGFNPPVETVSVDEDTLLNGMRHYSRICQVCHGSRAVSALIPDLRNSDQNVHEIWQDIVLGGALSANGMASFSDHVTAEDAEAIRQYILYEAAIAYEDQEATKD